MILFVLMFLKYNRLENNMKNFILFNLILKKKIILFYFTRPGFFRFTHFFLWEEKRTEEPCAFFFVLRKMRYDTTQEQFSRVFVPREPRLKITISIRTRGIESVYFFLASRTNAQCDAAVGLKSIIKRS